MDTKNGNVNSFSPTFAGGVKVEDVEVQVRFGNIIEPLLEGKKVHKLEWADRDFYALMEDGVLKLHKPDGKTYNWILSDGDLSGKDYVVL